MLNYYFNDTITNFRNRSTEEIIGSLTLSSQFDSIQNQVDAWRMEILILRDALQEIEGSIYFEFQFLEWAKELM